MSDSVDRVFVHALNTVKRIPRTGSARPPPAARLKLYGLYKQSMEGDVEGVMRRPEGSGSEEDAEREKWDAWHTNRSLSRTEAKRRYITTLIETMHAYASTTPEACELVSELEFVWDQIKSNPVSSSSASAPEHLDLPSSQSRSKLQQKRSHENVGGREPVQQHGVKEEVARSGYLRMLRPVSEPDEGEELEGDGDGFEEAPSSPSPDSENPVNFSISQSRDYDVRNRKWRKRIEAALVKLTTEVAALREQMEARRLFDGRPKGTAWAWAAWIAWATFRHVLIDAAIYGLLYMWFRMKDDQRLEQGIKLLGKVLTERGRRIRGWKRVKRADG